MRRTLRLAALLLIGVLIVASLVTAGDAQARVYRIGILETTSRSAAAPMLDAFRSRLRELGYVEGQNVVFEYRWAEGKAERFPRFAAELVGLNVDVIVTRGAPAALAAKRATSTIPIVMSSSGDPVSIGLVQTLARPGGNVTGLTAVVPDLAGKRLELLKEAFPHVSRIGFLWNPANPVSKLTFQEAQTGAQRLGLTFEGLPIQKPEDLERVLQTAVRARVQALSASNDAIFVHRAAVITEFAAKQRLLAIYASRELVEAGGLMSYAVHYPDLYRRAATYVDRILKGARPADLPVEQPTKFELVINLKTAKALGITIPQSLLLRADQVIP
ncbi:MAG: ABC transporter substrate-binding protein [Gemmatimonadetes bacterium]|nr:ABC transporter substrate-binding protein [Gemmatimonadota bacterium]